jgi:fatty acid desaturase
MIHAASDQIHRDELPLRAARALISRELGRDALERLHSPIFALDLAAIAGTISLFFFLAYTIANGSASDPLWWVCLVLQGNLVIVMGILNHDAFVHRKLLPPPLRWIVSQVLAWPAQLRSALYESRHLVHHRALGTDGDTEMHKHGLDTAWRRIVYATAVGIVARALFYRKVAVQQQLRPAHGGAARERWERGTRCAILALALASLAWDWRLLVLGYLLPFFTVTPLLNTLRIVLEHFDLDRSNALWVGTFYRTGPLTRLMFWWGAGDCHMVHHFYANIPFYRMPQALRLIRPILLRQGVHEHRSLVPLLRDWFCNARGHWSMPATAVKASERPRTV